MANATALHVADASVVINLNASGCAREIAAALPGRMAITDMVLCELEHGRPKGRQDAAMLRKLIEDGSVDLVRLDEAAEEHFAQLIIGPAEATLDDGEAATIAYAVRHSGIALIDERKATRLCASRFPGLMLQTSVDLFAHPAVLNALGGERRAQALFDALIVGRMRVPAHSGAWVIAEIGQDRAGQCSSLNAQLRGRGGLDG